MLSFGLAAPVKARLLLRTMKGYMGRLNDCNQRHRRNAVLMVPYRHMNHSKAAEQVPQSSTSAFSTRAVGEGGTSRLGSTP